MSSGNVTIQLDTQVLSSGQLPVTEIIETTRIAWKRAWLAADLSAPLFSRFPRKRFPIRLFVWTFGEYTLGPKLHENNAGDTSCPQYRSISRFLEFDEARPADAFSNRSGQLVTLRIEAMTRAHHWLNVLQPGSGGI